jgi:Yip1-like protein
MPLSREDTTMASMFRRMAGAARLDAATYEEVEADKSATVQAVAIAIVSSLAITIGDFHPGDTGVLAKLLGGVAGWIVWLFFIWLVGVKMIPEPDTRSDLGELIRTTGFGSTPGLFRILGLIPILGWLMVVAAWLWTLAAMIVAVRQALDYKSTPRAIVVCVVGFVGQLTVMYLQILLLRAATT